MVKLGGYDKLRARRREGRWRWRVVMKRVEVVGELV